MPLNSWAVTVAMLLTWTTVASAQQGDADHQQRLQAGREAAYRKFLLRAEPVEMKSQSGATVPATMALRAAQSQAIQADARRVFTAVADVNHVQRPSVFTAGVTDLRDLYYDSLNVRRGGRYSDYPIGACVFQPVWDSRYRRSWPRPVTVREYVKSHWLWDGVRYTYVPGHVKRETQWVTQGWPRYHWNGTHYSVTVSFR